MKYKCRRKAILLKESKSTGGDRGVDFMSWIVLSSAEGVSGTFIGLVVECDFGSFI